MPASPRCRPPGSARSSRRANALEPDVHLLLGDFAAGHRWRHAPRRRARMGGGARPAEGAARRARRPRQSRLVGRPRRAARGPRPGGRPHGAGEARHPRLRERRGAADEGRPAVLARRSRRPARADRRWRAGRRCGRARSRSLAIGEQTPRLADAYRRILGVDDLPGTLARITDDAPGDPDGARARHLPAGARARGA